MQTIPLQAQILILKTAGVGGVINESLTPLSGIDMALIYGSYASGQESGASDVDLLIVGSVDLNKLDRALAAAEKTLGRDTNYVSYTRKEFSARKRRKEGFLSDVLSNSVLMLVGNEDERICQLPCPSLRSGIDIDRTA